MRWCESETVKSRGSRGAATTATAVLLLVTLGTALGIAMASADRTMYTSQEYSDKTAGMMLAESAVEDAMAHLDSIYDWETITLPAQHFTPPHPVGRGMVWADIKNDAFDTGGSQDTNGLILVKGYGQMLNSKHVVSIEVLYWRPYLTIPPAGGVVVCGEDMVESNNGNITVDGFNHFLAPAPCSGSSCDPVRKYVQPDVAGFAFELAGQELKVALPRNILGAPPVASGVCWLQGPTGLCGRARTLMRNLPRVAGMETLTDWPITGRGTYGTVWSPKIQRVPEGTVLHLNGTSQGAGVLFIEGTLIQNGTFTFTGLIFVGPGAIFDIRGTANIFGSVVTTGSVGRPALLGLRGNGKIAWAADAISVGPFNLPGLMSSWREFN